MNIGAIADGVNKAKKLLRLANIDFKINKSKETNYLINKFSDEFFKMTKGINYDETCKTALENADYDILLSDYSFFQFSCSKNVNNIRYAFYEHPRDIKSYEKFVRDIGFSLKETGEELYDEYEQYVDEARLKKSITPIRYDYNIDLYEELKHPSSHFHVGFENEIRIPVSNIITPQAFLGFIIRHIYRDKWIKALDNGRFYNYYERIKNSCSELDENYFTQEEKKLFYLI